MKNKTTLMPVGRIWPALTAGNLLKKLTAGFRKWHSMGIRI